MEDPLRRPLLAPAAGLGLLAGALFAALGGLRSVAGWDLFLLGAGLPLIGGARLAGRLAGGEDAPRSARRILLPSALIGAGVAAAAARLLGPGPGAALLALAAGVAVGAALSPLAFAIAVPGAPRLLVSAAWLAGAAGGCAVLTGRPAGYAAAAGGMGWLLVLAGGRRLDPCPRRLVSEPMLRGAVGSLGTVLLGLAMPALLSSPRAGWGCAAGALLLATLQGRTRRSGVLLGVASALGALLVRLGADTSSVSAAEPSSVWPLLPEAAAGLAVGAGLAALPRFYVDMPPAKKLLRRFAFEDRPVPDGGVVRTGLLLAAAAAAVPAARIAGPAGGALALVAPGAALAVLGDARAGTARKGIAIALVAALTLAAASIGG